ncbi:MAG TPA: hypothetical protein VGC61_09750 [Pyrinomonadaceae bacterium]
MRTKFLTASVLLVSLLLFGVPSFEAQVSEKEKQEKELARKQLLKRNAYVLVEEIANGSLSLKLPENRSYLLAASADLLWDHAEPRAHNLFWDALNTLRLMNAPTGDEASAKDAKLSLKEKQRDQNLYSQVYALRDGLLRQVARHNPELALDMLRSSRQPPVESIAADFRLPDDRDLEQSIAAEAIARDPEQALQLARESLAKGLTFQVLDILYRLNSRNNDLGTKFAGDIIAKLTTRNLTTDQAGAHLAVALLTSSRTLPEPSDAKTAGLLRSRRLKLEPQQRRELVDKVTNAALEGSANPNLLYAVSAVMPEIKEFAPERVVLLQKKLAAFNQTLNQEQKISLEFNSLFDNGTAEEMLKVASRASESEREWMQQQAVLVAVMRKRTDALREFLNTSIENEGRRKTLLDTLDAEQINYAVSKGDAEELRKLLPQVRRKEERARAMVEIAIVMEKNGDHDEALKLLDEAQVMIKLNLESETQTNAMLTLVAGYALVEPARAFSIVERMIDRTNDNLAKWMLLDKIVKTGMVEKGEIRWLQSGMMPIDFALLKYGKAIAALANADFDRTKAIADRFQRNEVRLMVRLLIAQALLKDDAQTQ